MTEPKSINEYIEAIPKVELHVHLEGSVQIATLLRLACQNNVDLPVSTIEEARDWFKFRERVFTFARIMSLQAAKMSSIYIFMLSLDIREMTSKPRNTKDCPCNAQKPLGKIEASSSK